MNVTGSAAVPASTSGLGVIPGSPSEPHVSTDAFDKVLSQHQESTSATGSPSTSKDSHSEENKTTPKEGDDKPEDADTVNLMAAYILSVQPLQVTPKVVLPLQELPAVQGEPDSQGVSSQGLSDSQGLPSQGLSDLRGLPTLQGSPSQGLSDGQGLPVLQGLPSQGLSDLRGLPALQGLPSQGLPDGQGSPALQGLPPQGLPVEQAQRANPSSAGVPSEKSAGETLPSTLGDESGSVAATASIPSPFSGTTRQKLSAAKNAAPESTLSPVAPPQSSENPAKMPPLEGTIAVPSGSGMSVAVQHASMSVEPSKLPKSAPMPVEAHAPAQGPSGARIDAVKPVEANLPEQEFSDNDGGAASDGQTQFDGTSIIPAVPLATSNKATPAAFVTKLDSAQETASILNHLTETAERMRSDGRTNVQLQVHLRDGQEVTIQLRMQDGAFHPVFKTESAELRSALEQNWNQFTSQSGDRGLRIATPVFQTAQSGMGDLGHRQEREPQQQPQSEKLPHEEFQLFQKSKSRPSMVSPVAGNSAAERTGTLTLFA